MPGFLPGESHGQRTLVGYSPQSHKESDTTERLHFKNNLLIKKQIQAEQVKMLGDHHPLESASISAVTQ